MALNSAASRMQSPSFVVVAGAGGQRRQPVDGCGIARVSLDQGQEARCARRRHPARAPATQARILASSTLGNECGRQVLECLPGQAEIAGSLRQLEPGSPDDRVVRPPAHAGIEPLGGRVELAGSNCEQAAPEPDTIVVRFAFFQVLAQGQKRQLGQLLPRELADQRLGCIGVPPALEQRSAHVIGPAFNFEEHGQLLQETELARAEQRAQALPR